MKVYLFTFLTFILCSFVIINYNEDSYVADKFDIQLDDTTSITINQVVDKITNFPIYYYSDLLVPACNTGECKIIDLKMFWDIYGNYYKYEVRSDRPLTKYDHKEFKAKEYIKLHMLLCDTSSKLKDIKFNDLTEKQAGKKYKETDGSSGETIRFFGSSNVQGAVKTTHTLWHIAHGKALHEINELTNNYLLTNDKSILYKKLNSSNSLKKLVENFDDLSVTEVSTLLKNIEEENVKQIEITLENTLGNRNIENKILVSNYFLRPKIKTKKVKSCVSNFSFIK